MFNLSRIHPRILFTKELHLVHCARLCANGEGNDANNHRPHFAHILPTGQVYIRDKNRYFLDSLRFHVIGGSGGNGYPKFDGLGGNGGNVYLVAKDGVTLRDVKRSKLNKNGFKGNDGQHSANYSIIGQNGKDIEIEVPTGVSVIHEDTKRTLAELNNINDRVAVAFGGRGGDRKNSFCGSKGQKTLIKLDLKMIADVGLVGFPNAGKSTLLRALSRASPKIASYPFTTIKPNLGVIEYGSQSNALMPLGGNAKTKRPKPSEFYQEDFRQITVADLPGLIEGAHKNIGLGHKFLKHIVRTKLLLFVVDIDGFRNAGGVDFHQDWTTQEPIQVIQSLVNELDLYDPNILRTKPSLLVVSKLDSSPQRDRFTEMVQQLQNTKITIPSKEMIRRELREGSEEVSEVHGDFEFDKVVGISAVKRYNIERLKGMIRRLIDLDAESKREDISFKQLMEKNKSDLDLDDIVDEDEDYRMDSAH